MQFSYTKLFANTVMEYVDRKVTSELEYRRLSISNVESNATLIKGLELLALILNISTFLKQINEEEAVIVNFASENLNIDKSLVVKVDSNVSKMLF